MFLWLGLSLLLVHGFGAPPIPSRARAKALSAATVAPPAQHLEWISRMDHSSVLIPKSPTKRSFWSRIRPSKHTETDQRKVAWMSKYATVAALRRTFGSNRQWYGDLNHEQTRRLYHTLLPKALLELHATGVEAHDLAPLAYQARVAAKIYARERAYRHLSYGSHLLDGFRTLSKYGSFSLRGMSYEQVWEKYAQQVMEEVGDEDLPSEDVTARICWQILESSCRSNAVVDKLCGLENAQDLQDLTEDLDVHVRAILDESKAEPPLRYHTLQTIARVKRRLEKLRRNLE